MNINKKGFVGGFTAGIVIIIGIILLMISTCKVPAGYVAVQYNMNGGVKDEVLTQGWHLVSPTVHTTLYTIGIEQSYLTSGKQGDSDTDESFVASSSEGKAVTIDLTFTYQYDAQNVTSVFTKFKGQSGKEVRDSFIKPNIVSWTKEVVARYKIADILGAERANINIALTDYLSEKFIPYGITISNVSLINLEVDQTTMDAINAKINAQQAAEQQAIENQMNIDKADADAKAKVTKAQADADALLIEAQAEAEANELLTKSLSEEILNKMYYDKWDGVLPQVVGSENSIVMPISNFNE